MPKRILRDDKDTRRNYLRNRHGPLRDVDLGRDGQTFTWKTPRDIAKGRIAVRKIEGIARERRGAFLGLLPVFCGWRRRHGDAIQDWLRRLRY